MSYKKLTLIIFLYLFIISKAFTQSAIVTGRIIDSINNEAISFANLEIFCKKTGCAADENGKYSLDVSKLNIQDTVSVSALGYNTQNIIISELQQKKEIKLSKAIYKLNEVSVSASVKYVNKGNYLKKTNFSSYFYQAGDQIWCFIPASETNKEVLCSVFVYINEIKTKHNLGNINRPFRVRLYEVDTTFKEKKKGRDLILDNLIANSEKKGWYEIDVSKYNLVMPKNGVFAAIEMIEFSTKVKDGIMIGCKKIKKTDSNTWFKYIGQKGIWHEELKFNAMIYIKVKEL